MAITNESVQAVRISVRVRHELHFGALCRPRGSRCPAVKVLAARDTFGKNRHGVFHDTSVWVVACEHGCLHAHLHTCMHPSRTLQDDCV